MFQALRCRNMSNKTGNLSCNIFALQFVEECLLVLKSCVQQLFFVAESRKRFYFMQQSGATKLRVVIRATMSHDKLHDFVVRITPPLVKEWWNAVLKEFIPFQLSQIQHQMQQLKLQKTQQMPFQQQHQSYQQPNTYNSNNMFSQQQAMKNIMTQQQSMHYQHQKQPQFISTGPSTNMFPMNGMPSSGHTFNNQLWK